MMNALVVYDTQFGNTERVAQRIASTLREYGKVQVAHVNQIYPGELQEVDLLILGCPTQGFRPTQAMQTFLRTVAYQSLSHLSVACFDTRFRGALWKHSAAPYMVKQLHTQGIEPIVPPESFFVKALKKAGPLLPGELEHAARWSRLLFIKVEQSRLIMKQ